MRVYELAKKLGIENKALLPELKKMGVGEVFTPGASTLDIVEYLNKVLPKINKNEKII